MHLTGARYVAALALAALAACQSVPVGKDSYLQTDDGLLLHYREIGEGPDVLVVPGACWVAEDLVDLADDRRVIFYDLRGRGRSDPEASLSLEEDLKDLETVRKWFQLERFSILGAHYHAALGAHYAAAHPERVARLVMASPIPAKRDPYWKIYERVYQERLGTPVASILRKLRREGLPRKDPEAWATAYRETLFTAFVADPSSLNDMRSRPFTEPNANPERATSRYLALIRSLGRWDWSATLASVQAPTLVVVGDEDAMPAEASAQWATSIPNAGTEVIEDAGRFPWFESRRSFMSAVETFLNGDAR